MIDPPRCGPSTGGPPPRNWETPENRPGVRGLTIWDRKTTPELWGSFSRLDPVGEQDLVHGVQLLSLDKDKGWTEIMIGSPTTDHYLTANELR